MHGILFAQLHILLAEMGFDRIRGLRACVKYSGPSSNFELKLGLFKDTFATLFDIYLVFFDTPQFSRYRGLNICQKDRSTSRFLPGPFLKINFIGHVIYQNDSSFCDTFRHANRFWIRSFLVELCLAKVLHNVSMDQKNLLYQNQSIFYKFYIKTHLLFLTNLNMQKSYQFDNLSLSYGQLIDVVGTKKSTQKIFLKFF